MSDSSDPVGSGRLFSAGYLGLLATQLLGTLNDNMFRWFVVCVAQPTLGTNGAISIGLAAFTVPYLVLAVPAGFLADRFSKRSVIVACKVAEIIIMALGLAAIVHGDSYLLVSVVAIMGAQSALFGPSKYGAIPELVSHDDLSRANGLMGLVTVGASAVGMVAGYWLFGETREQLGSWVPELVKAGTVAAPPGFGDLALPAMALIGVAFVGTAASLLIPRLKAAAPERKYEVNPFAATARDLKVLWKDRVIRRTALGIAFFWMLASLAQSNVDPFGEGVLEMEKSTVGILGAILVVGVGIGSVLAGVISGDKVELGLVPLGASVISLSSMALLFTGNQFDPALPPMEQASFYLSCVCLVTLGIGSGFFSIPLDANLQHQSDPEVRGTVLASTNFLTFSFILLAAFVFWLLRTVLAVTPGEIFLLAGLATIPVIYYAFQVLPQATIRFLVYTVSHLVYRVRVVGRKNIPEKGGALLVCNHVTWLDGILLLMVSERPIRMLAYADFVERKGFVNWICRTFGVIPIKPEDGPKSLLRSLKIAREAVMAGELVCIFAEGQLTRTGQLQPFQRGLMRIVEGTDLPVIPTYLDELWGSIFSYHGGKFFWKRPLKWPYPVTIMFGEPIKDADNVGKVRRAVEELGVAAVEYRQSNLIPARQFLRACRKAKSRSKVADSAGADLTGLKLLTGSLVFRRVLNRGLLPPDEKNVGVLLPPSVGGALANTALSIMGRVAVNLNYTLNDDVLNYCIKEAGIRHVITSRRFLEKKPMELDAELIFAEDIKEHATGLDKVCSLVSAAIEPLRLLERRLGLTRINPNDLMTIIFTSGSTGEPKGVMLSHKNVASNIYSADQLFQIKTSDSLLGILPFFHSFGYSLMLWLPMTLEPKGVYHFNPLDGRMIGKLCEEHAITIIAATPTFLKTYLKRCTPEQMSKMDLAICGAEKLPQSLAEEFHEKFGIWPTEGFGTTELSPLAAANVPDHRNNAAAEGQTGTKMGTVGRPVPNVAARVVDPDSGEELGLNRPGLLHIKGPNVMLGYLNQPEKTAEVIQDGWYNTGDIAVIDDDGFITITGRLSRFSKIGGEMVPHIRIEEVLTRIVEDVSSDEPEIRVAVTAVPHEQKGERIVVLHKPLSRPVDEIIKELSAAGLPNLWIPSADSFIEVEEIPLLGTGKLDLRGIKARAMEAFPAGALS
jgi:acyl-[acyl-carrier-protein]-phospholipid O-acyltransferase/long-chain-fatty-acid--[acyl-carrier-protein] ligase